MTRTTRIHVAARSAAVLCLLVAPLAARAEDYTYATNRGTITITRYKGPGGAVTIPEKINGLPVTSIDYHTFSRCASLTDVTIPNTVTNIESYAFAECGLTSVTIPSSVRRIGDTPFLYCDRLTAIGVDPLNPRYSSVDGVLFNKRQTSLLQYPGGKAGNYTVPSTVSTIGWNAFSYCNGLANVTIPSSVTNIGPGAFSLCTGLSAIIVDALNSSYSSVDGVLFNKSQTELIQHPAGKAGDYTIPSSVTWIGERAFAWCTNPSVTIPNGVTSIGREAFLSCSRLTHIVIPNSVTRISDKAFDRCTRLATITIGSGVTSIERETFQLCTSLTDVTIPNSVTNIGNLAFRSCSSLTNILIGNKVKNIGAWAFSDCTNLSTVMIPRSVTQIGRFAFAYCTSLTAVCFQGNAPDAPPDAFYGATKATVYYLPGTARWGSTFGSRPTAPSKP